MCSLEAWSFLQRNSCRKQGKSDQDRAGLWGRSARTPGLPHSAASQSWVRIGAGCAAAEGPGEVPRVPAGTTSQQSPPPGVLGTTPPRHNMFRVNDPSVTPFPLHLLNSEWRSLSSGRGGRGLAVPGFRGHLPLGQGAAPCAFRFPTWGLPGLPFAPPPSCCSAASLQPPSRAAGGPAARTPGAQRSPPPSSSVKLPQGTEGTESPPR